MQKPVPKCLPSGKVSKKAVKKANKSSSAASFTREEKAEMRRLSAMLPLPTRTEKHEQDPCELLNDTTCYINHLLATVYARVQAGSLPREVLDTLHPSSMMSSPSSSSTSSSASTSPTYPISRRSRTVKPNL